MKKVLVTITTLFLVFFSAVPAFADVTAVNSNAGANLSKNWAGYAALNGQCTSVSGTWTVPEVSAPLASGDATWVGIGGLNSSDLIQSGTEAVVDSAGTVTYDAWYELLPNTSVDVPVAIKAGDSVSVSLQQIAQGEWQISFRDNTTGESSTLTVNYASSLSSAEWIEEMPMVGNGFLPLDNFGTTNFSNGYATQNGMGMTIASTQATPIIMVNANQKALAMPTTLNADGASFSVSRTTAAASTSSLVPGTPRVFRGRGGSRTGVRVQGFASSPSLQIRGRFGRRSMMQNRFSVRFIFPQ
jgi:hypothetical protein